MFKGIGIHVSSVALLVVVLALVPGAAPVAIAGQAQDLAGPPGGPAPTGIAAVTAGEPPNPYYRVAVSTLRDGRQVDQHTIAGPAEPPPGYDLQRRPVAPSELGPEGPAASLEVPAYDWVFGCYAVSAAMIGAYYDRGGFANIYTGPANGGVMPMDNSVWPTWTDGAGKTYPSIPLAASRKGLDGRTTRGSIDDYWVSYLSTAADPYITGGWTQHAWGDAFGDYMKTSQSGYGNRDGETAFWAATASPDRLTCAEIAMEGLASTDAAYGRKLFYEARGYTVADCYNQNTDNQVAGGFSFADYRAQINAGHPVFLYLQGHAVVGVGYSDPSTVYINDTWDRKTHSMTWGGSYSGMQLLAAGIVIPVGGSTPPPTITGLSPSSAKPGGPAFTLTVNGTNFVNGSVVLWNGANRSTTYVSSTRVKAAITAADIAKAGTATVTVRNPAPGGGVSNAVSFHVGSLRKVYLPAAVKAATGPQPGFWRGGLLEFYVTSDRQHVDDFAIHVTGDCGSYKITHLVPEPISGNSFSFTGTFYGSGVFSSATTANVTTGLDDYYIPGCGYVSGGPWNVAATWQHAAAATWEGIGGAGIDVAEPDAGLPGAGTFRVR